VEYVSDAIKLSPITATSLKAAFYPPASSRAVTTLSLYSIQAMTNLRALCRGRPSALTACWRSRPKFVRGQVSQPARELSTPLSLTLHHTLRSSRPDPRYLFGGGPRNCAVNTVRSSRAERSSDGGVDSRFVVTRSLATKRPRLANGSRYELAQGLGEASRRIRDVWRW